MLLQQAAEHEGLRLVHDQLFSTCLLLTSSLAMQLVISTWMCCLMTAVIHCM